MSINRTWLDAEPLVLARLRSVLTGVSVVLKTDAPTNASELPVPCVVLSYVGYDVLNVTPDGKQATLRAAWHVLVVDRDGPETDPAGPARSRLADLCAATLGALMGWRVPGFPLPLKPTPAPGAFTEGGLLFHPCGFALQFVAAATE